MTNEINVAINRIEYENVNTELGLVPDFKFLPEKINTFMRKDVEDIEDIYLERMTYLINIDDLLEELLK